ncbi:MAG TPA: SMP-30/gluconolactonase/LRE family protein [Pyrinomonadaceae bacterium]|nr:SMP-30/gluconolactonase/LRE family protein [Pyrinomonadaceae bacterium]
MTAFITQHRRLILILLVSITILVLYFLFWPVSISPQVWEPQVAPALVGPYQQNSILATTERLSLGTDNPRPGARFAPEDVALDSSGRIYSGLDDGRIVRLQADGTKPEIFSNTHGRPLGLVFDSTGNLIVADAIKGLLSVSADGSVTVLTTAADGLPFGCTNDLDVAADGTIYFTDASSKFPLTEFTSDILEHGPNGRLLAYDPKTKTTRTLLTHLCFANGVALSPDQSFVLVVETGKYRVYRVWLNQAPGDKSRGSKWGESEIFIDNLPGFPDGISSNGKDRFWLALVAPRDALLDKLLPHPFLRKVVARLPRFLQPAPKHYSFVLGLDTNGRIVNNLQDGSPACYAEIANVVERNGLLYFGSIGESSVGRFRLP